MIRGRFFTGLFACACLVGCGGGSASVNGGQIAFTAPASGAVPAGTTAIQYSVIDAAGHTTKQGTTQVGGGTVMITGLPVGSTVVNAYANGSDGTTLASGRVKLNVGSGSTPVSVNFSPVPPPVATEQYVLSGTVCTDPDNHTSGRISLHAVIDEVSDLAQTGYTGANFRIFEDGIELSPFTVGHANTIARAREDICFVLDSTAAESNELAGVANSISAFATQMAGADQNVQFAGVEYGENVRSMQPLSPSVTAIQNWAKGLVAHGGDGIASDPLDAVKAALSFKWRMDSQHILIVVTSLPMYEAGDAANVTQETPELIAQAIKSGFVVDSICPLNGTPPAAPSPHIKYISVLSNTVGGMTIPLPADGNVNLANLDIDQLIFAGYVFQIPSSLHTPPVNHTMRVYLQDGSGSPLADVYLPGSY